MSDLDALVAAAGLCWPGARVTATRAREPGVVVEEFVPVPSAARPKLLVPVAPPAAAAAAVSRYSHSLGPRERAVRAALGLGLRVGAAQRLIRDRVVVAGDVSESLVTHLAEQLGGPVRVSLGVGTARANRKPVLQVLSPAGRSLAFAKLGDSPLTRDLLRGEAAALRRLAEVPVTGLRAPRLLGLSHWNGLDVLLQEALPTPVRTRGGPDDVPLAGLGSLAAAFATGPVPLASTPLWRRLQESVALVAEPGRRELFRQVLADATAAHGTTEVAGTAWHGDLTPWNLAWTRTGLNVWDWERFAEGVPAGLDLLHWSAARAARDRSWPEVLSFLSRDPAAVLAGLGVVPGAAPATLRAYLLELCRRYLLAAQPPGGEPLRAQTDDLLTHLARSSTHPGTGILLPPWHAEPGAPAIERTA